MRFVLATIYRDNFKFESPYFFKEKRGASTNHFYSSVPLASLQAYETHKNKNLKALRHKLSFNNSR